MTHENPGDIIGRTLWGDPVYRVSRVRGRPPFEWTEENSFKVSMLLAAGWTNTRIAGTILDPRTGKSISVPTLKRYFRAELTQRDHARDQLVAKQLMVAADQAFAGNVGAMRLLDQLMAKNDQRLAASKMTQPDAGDDDGEEDAKPTSRYVGKGELSRKKANALASGEEQSDWGSLLRPGSYEN
ncbi:resolvase [Paracoccus onubensis]|uniref:Resolvase n=1 Tax=Paracoccus onubensis TaxID=1675788 RepID=A0A418T4D1_9RHOB|nr:resolvase [Paracoccus onubensis]RJE87970.1 resolvase [Paracoccus onubensis]